MSEAIGKIITPGVIDGALSYDEYREMIDELLEQDKTTGTNHSDEMVEYTRMNVHRMSRLDKQVELKDSLVDEIKQLDQEWVWLIITEAWCGDAAQNIPALVKMTNLNENINLKFILRDQHIDIMDEYLTNGGRSIPKLVCLNAETLEELGTWGPRPEVLQEKAMAWKEDPDTSMEEWAEKLHAWYAHNMTRRIQSEFEELIADWKNAT